MKKSLRNKMYLPNNQIQKKYTAKNTENYMTRNTEEIIR